MLSLSASVPDSFAVAVIGCVILAFALLAWTWHLSGRVLEDRERLLKMQRDVDKGIDALGVARSNADQWLRIAKAQYAADRAAPKTSPKPGQISAGERFRRLMDDDGEAGHPAKL